MLDILLDLTACRMCLNVFEISSRKDRSVVCRLLIHGRFYNPKGGTNTDGPVGADRGGPVRRTQTNAKGGFYMTQESTLKYTSILPSDDMG